MLVRHGGRNHPARHNMITKNHTYPQSCTESCNSYHKFFILCSSERRLTRHSIWLLSLSCNAAFDVRLATRLKGFP